MELNLLDGNLKTVPVRITRTSDGFKVEDLRNGQSIDWSLVRDSLDGYQFRQLQALPII